MDFQQLTGAITSEIERLESERVDVISAHDIAEMLAGQFPGGSVAQIVEVAEGIIRDRYNRGRLSETDIEAALTRMRAGKMSLDEVTILIDRMKREAAELYAEADALRNYAASR